MAQPFLVEYFGRETFDRIFFSLITLMVLVSAYLDLKAKNYPPSAIGTPIFGYLPMLNPKTPYNTLKDLASHYGKVFSVYLGSVYTVVITDVKLIRQAFNLDTFHEKAPLQLASKVANGRGILMADEDRWKQHRFFLMSALKNLGTTKGKSGRVILEDKIQAALGEFVQDMKKLPISGGDIRPALRHSVGSLMFDVVTGMRPTKEDPQWKKIQNVLTDQLKMMSITDSTNFVALLKNFGKYAKTLGGLFTGKQEAIKLYKKCVEKYGNADSASECKSIVEAYVAEQKRRQEKDDESFSTEQVSQVLLDTLTMGWETTLDSLQWLYIYLAMYPEIQDYILREMELNLGSNQKETLSLEDCKKLPYTEAVIMEVWRHRPVLPMGLPHCATERTKIGTYWIEKGTMVVPLIYAVHRDQRYWDKPDEFLPERHLEDDGTIRKSDYFIPFQTGKKACIGEELAQWTLLLFLAGVLRKYKISFAKGIKYSPDDLPDFSMTSTPPSYRLMFEARD